MITPDKREYVDLLRIRGLDYETLVFTRKYHFFWHPIEANLFGLFDLLEVSDC